MGVDFSRSHLGDQSGYRRDLTDEQERDQIKGLITYLLIEQQLGP